MDEATVKDIYSKLNLEDLLCPENLAIYGQLSVSEREEFALKTSTMVVYLGTEVDKVQAAEETAAMAAVPIGYHQEHLNGINVGCGGRQISPYLIQIDIMRSQPDIAVTGTHGSLNPHCYLSLADMLPFRAEAVDYIVSLHTLEHLENPVRTINHWLDVIKPGGGIGIIVPRWEYTWDSRTDNSIFGHKWNPTPSLIKKLHDHYWDDRAILEKIETYEFKISFDFVLRKRGVFQSFCMPDVHSMMSGKQRYDLGRFLG